MKKIKDPALFEKIRKFLTEDMPVLRKKSPNTVEAYRYTLNIYLVFLCEKHSKSLYNITVKDFSQKNILFFISDKRLPLSCKICTQPLPESRNSDQTKSDHP